jgi:Trp operon repressor
VAANRVCWESHSTLVATMSHFLELDADLEVLESDHFTGLTEDEVDALWSRVRVASDLLASHVPSSVARHPPDSVGE